MSVAPVRVVVFAEDGAWWARDVLRKLLVGMTRGLWHTPVNVSGALEFVPDEDIAPGVLQLSVARAWKNPRDQSVKFVREVRQFLEQGFVVVIHFDADCLWTERHRPDKAINMAQFQREVLNRLEQNAPEAPDWRERLLLFVPHDELESWLFQNTVATKTLLRDAKLLNESATALLDGWSKDRGALDRTKSPKDLLPVGGLSLLSLAETGFPTAEVRALRTSYTKAMARVRRCGPLRRAVMQLVTRAQRRARRGLSPQPFAQNNSTDRA